MSSTRNEKIFVFATVVVTTIALGFLAWWTLPLVAFSSALWLTRSRKQTFLKAIQTATLAPAVGWIATALVRDLFEGMRMSYKLAGLLHLGFGVFVYVALFVLVALISFFAAWSGAETSKTLR